MRGMFLANKKRLRNNECFSAVIDAGVCGTNQTFGGLKGSIPSSLLISFLYLNIIWQIL